jgi:hypothetical protein
MEAIWNANPNVNMLFCFEDGNCFEKLSDAVAYKRTTQMDYERVERPKEKEEVNEEVKETKTKNKK